jgi:hypothetical protein
MEQTLNYRDYKSQQLVHNVSQMNPVHTLIPLIKIQFNIILYCKVYTLC